MNNKEIDHSIYGGNNNHNEGMKKMTVKILNQMKFGMLITLTLLLTFSGFVSTASADTNLVANPGFESGTTTPLNWKFTTNNGNTPVWDTISYSGAKSIKISITGTTQSNSGYPLSDKIIVQPLQTYTLSAWVKSEGVKGGPTVRVVQYDSSWKSLRQINLEFDRGTKDWTQKQMEFQTLSNTAFVLVYANIWNGYGTFWVDDMELRLKSTSASTPSPTPTQTPKPTPTPTPASTPIPQTTQVPTSPTSSGTNLVANPGFESGSTRPDNWKFATSNGNTPVWDKISYSGAKSIKISIPGTTQSNSGYPLSDKIIVKPLQTYTLSALVKSEGVKGGPTVRVVQYDSSWKSLRQINLEFDRGTKDWTQKQIDFQTLSNTAFVLVYASIWNGYGTFWVDDMELRLKSTSASAPTPTPTPTQTPKPTPTPTPTSTPIPQVTPAPSGGAISINPDKTLNVNGKKTFPVYMYSICNAHFESSTGVEPCNPSKNSEFTFSVGPLYYQNYPAMDYKNKFERAGVFYTMDASTINKIPQHLIDSPAFFGYYQIDEPVNDKLGSVKDVYNKVKLIDTKHPVILNHWRDMTMWAPYSDVITWDIYTIRNTQHWPREDSIYAYEQWSEQAFFKGTNLNSINKPVWAVIQANGVPKSDMDLVIPTPKEVRANTYTAITMDVKGVGFWSYLGWGGSLESTSKYPYGTSGLYNNPELHAYYRQLGRELVSFNDILVLPTKDYSWEYRKGTMVSFSKNPTKTVLWKTRNAFNYMLKQDGNTWYLIVVNKDSKPINDVKLTINGLTGTKTAKTLGLETSGSQRAGRTLSVNNGQFTDSFDGYAAHIYKIS